MSNVYILLSRPSCVRPYPCKIMLLIPTSIKTAHPVVPLFLHCTDNIKLQLSISCKVFFFLNRYLLSLLAGCKPDHGMCCGFTLFISDHNTCARQRQQSYTPPSGTISLHKFLQMHPRCKSNPGLHWQAMLVSNGLYFGDFIPGL